MAIGRSFAMHLKTTSKVSLSRSVRASLQSYSTQVLPKQLEFVTFRAKSLSAYAACTTERTFLWWFLSMGDPQTMGFPVEISTLDDFQVPQVERNTILIHIVGMFLFELGWTWNNSGDLGLWIGLQLLNPLLSAAKPFLGKCGHAQTKRRAGYFVPSWGFYQPRITLNNIIYKIHKGSYRPTRTSANTAWKASGKGEGGSAEYPSDGTNCDWPYFYHIFYHPYVSMVWNSRSQTDQGFFYLQTDQAQNIIVMVLALSVWVLSQQIEAETTQFWGWVGRKSLPQLEVNLASSPPPLRFLRTSTLPQLVGDPDTMEFLAQEKWHSVVLGVPNLKKPQYPIHPSKK